MTVQHLGTFILLTATYLPTIDLSEPKGIKLSGQMGKYKWYKIFVSPVTLREYTDMFAWQQWL